MRPYRSNKKPWPSVFRGQPGSKLLSSTISLKDQLHADLHNARSPGAVHLPLAPVVRLARAIAVRTCIAWSGRACLPERGSDSALAGFIAWPTERGAPVLVRRTVASCVDALVFRVVEGVERLPAELQGGMFTLEPREREVLKQSQVSITAAGPC